MSKMKKSVTLFIAGFSLFLGIVATSSPALALDEKAETGFKKGLTQAGGDGSSSVPATVKNIINLLLYIAGIAAVIIIVIGGIRFVTSEGDSQKTAKARDIIVNAAIGLVLAILAYAAVNFILDQFS